MKRGFIAICHEAAVEASRENDDAEADTHIARLTERLSRIGNTADASLFEDAHTVTQRIIDILNADSDIRKPQATGLRKLDTAMDGGLHPGRFCGFAARKKVGKTALAATISANLNRQQVKHLFICGEMSSVEVHQRILARYCDAFPTDFRNGHAKTPEFQDKFTAATAAITKNTLYANAPGLTFSDLRQRCMIAVERNKVRGILLDYLQLVGGVQKNQTKASHLDEVTQWLANFGRKHGVWILALVQINQDGNTRDGEGIRLACDQLFALHREDLSAPGAWIEMLETRHTGWQNIGKPDSPGLMMNFRGPYFEEK
jgi:replicative DNA helicase